jgi:hypothetical protein
MRGDRAQASISRRLRGGQRPTGAGRLAAAGWLAAGGGGGYLMSVSILNIGRYIEMTIVPTITPTPIIRIGSMIEVND